MTTDEAHMMDILENIKEEPIPMYHIGDNWCDLCAGPHIETTPRINRKAFDLESVIGACRRGAKSKPMLQGKWENQGNSKLYLELKEQAARPDHRRIGYDFDLFSIQDDAGAKRKLDFAGGKSRFFQTLCNSAKSAAFLVALALLAIPSANAVDALKTCACLLKECRPELVKCISNPSCAANIACLQTCNNRPDETECQIKCGDVFENSTVDEFNDCAVSRKKCVPRKSDVGEFPAPDPAVLVSSFDLDSFNGRWYITSGLNPSFDTFDCQVHEFHTESGKLVGNLSWRIKTPDAGFITRSATQKFMQDPKYPGILYNHDNEFLHYQDDWYILSSKVENQPDDYIFVYYRGSNDAWDGYGGAVVYTRSPVLPESIIPQLETAARNVNHDFKRFTRTDNSCGPEPLLIERLEKTVEEGEEIIAKEVEEIKEEVGKVADTERTLLQRLYEGFQELLNDGNYFIREVSEEEMEILRDLDVEAKEIDKLFRSALPLRKLR